MILLCHQPDFDDTIFIHIRQQKAVKVQSTHIRQQKAVKVQS